MRRVLAALMALFMLTGCTPTAAGAGVRLAYIWQGDLYVIRPGREPRQRTRGAGASMPRWSADGRWIAYRTGEQLWVAPAYGEGVRRVAERAGEFAWAPSGASLAYVSGHTLYRADVPLEGAISSTEVHAPAADFAWSPNGTQFAVYEPMEGPWPSERRTGRPGIAVVPAAGGSVKEIYRQEPVPDVPGGPGNPRYAPIANFTWSPDSRWITFHEFSISASISADGVSLKALPVSGGTPTDLGTMLGYRDWVRWHPDADLLAYIAGPGRMAWINKNLTLTTPPGFKERILTPEGYTDIDPAWAPCGAPRLATARTGPDSLKDKYDRPLPAIYVDGKQRSRPPAPFGDVSPYLDCQGRLGWVRVAHNQPTTVFYEGEPLAQVDEPGWYYGHWSVDSVLAWWSPGR